MKAVKRHEPPVIRQIITRDITHSMINVINIAACYTQRLLKE